MRALAAAILVMAAHSMALGSGFVDFDDDTIFLDNPLVRDGSLAQLFSLERTDWRPLRDLSHRLDWALHGQDAFWAHAHNLLLLGIVVWLCARLLGRLGTSPRAAAIVAGLSFLHPVQVESIAWVSGRKELLAGICFFALVHACLAWLRGRRWALPVVGLAFALGVMAKGHVIVAPLALVGLGAHEVWSGRARWRRVVAPVVVTAALAALAVPLVLRGGVMLPDGLAGEQFTVTLGDQVQIPLRYLATLVWPVELNHIYLTPPFDAGYRAWTVASLLAVLVVVAAWVRGLRARHPAAGLALVPAALLLPYLHLHPGSVYMADRYLFLVVPFVAFLCWRAASALADHLALRPPLRVGAIVSLALVWLLVGAQQHLAWRDSVSLWSRMTDVYPTSDWGYGRLGIALYEAGDYAAAGGAFVEASRRAPDRQVHRQNAAAAMAALGHGGAAAALLSPPADGRQR